MKFDLADAYFRKGRQRSGSRGAHESFDHGQQDATFWPYSETSTPVSGNTARAEEIFRDAINRNPDNDQYYLSLTSSNCVTKMSLAQSRPCKKAWREFPAPERFFGAWALSPLSRARPDKLRSVWSGQWICCPNGPAATPRSASSTIRPDKSKRLAKCSIASKEQRRRPGREPNRRSPVTSSSNCPFDRGPDVHGSPATITSTGAVARRPHAVTNRNSGSRKDRRRMRQIARRDDSGSCLEPSGGLNLTFGSCSHSCSHLSAISQRKSETDPTTPFPSTTPTFARPPASLRSGLPPQPKRKYYLETMGTGVAWLDYDQDGLMDLYLRSICRHRYLQTSAAVALRALPQQR